MHDAEEKRLSRSLNSSLCKLRLTCYLKAQHYVLHAFPCSTKLSALNVPVDTRVKDKNSFEFFESSIDFT